MAKKVHPSVLEDFTGVVEFLKAKRIIPANPPAQMLAYAKRMHYATYSMILWKFRLAAIPTHGTVFLEEIASDSLQILPQALMGYVKTTKLLMRGVIENTLRHLYFVDHPIEFERMNREKKWYPQTEELFQYPALHPRLMAPAEKFDAVNRLRTLYDDLSAGVHGRRVKDFEMRAALAQIEYNEASFEDQVKETETCAISVNFLLFAFHVEQARRFRHEERQVLLHIMPPGARQVLTDIE